MVNDQARASRKRVDINVDLIFEHPEADRVCDRIDPCPRLTSHVHLCLFHVLCCHFDKYEFRQIWCGCPSVHDEWTPSQVKVDQHCKMQNKGRPSWWTVTAGHWPEHWRGSSLQDCSSLGPFVDFCASGGFLIFVWRSSMFGETVCHSRPIWHPCWSQKAIFQLCFPDNCLLLTNYF